MRNTFTRAILLAGSAMLLSGTAYAQTAPGDDDDATNEIVVTGQKRVENIQDISVAATVISGDDLTSKGIDRLDDLQTIVPSLSISDAGLTQSFNIRGVGLASGSPNAANGVATYYDGVFQPPIVTTNSFYDIQSVEVFRGPQGTFVGSNSTGGAIFINSKDAKPGDYSGYVQGEVGSFSRFGVQAALNAGLTDTLAIRVALNYKKRDSYYTNLTARPAPGSLDERGIRAGLTYDPEGGFKAVLKAEWDFKESGGYANRPILGTRYQGFRTSDIYILNHDVETAAGFQREAENDERARQFTSRLEYETDSGITFRSVSGYQFKDIQNFLDTDATNAATLPKTTIDQYVRETVLTQEVNVISPTTGPFNWVLGGYYQKNKILVDIANSPNTPVHTEIDIQNRKITTGLFGQVSYDISDQFSVDVGARYSWYKVTGTGAVVLARPNGPLFLADPGGAENDSALTGKIALNWKPNDNHLIYAFAARGYKSGGIQTPTTVFLPEKVMDYEIGWKGTFADGALTTQLGAFYYDYKNFQLDVIEPTTGRAALINLTNAKIKGFEGQIQYRSGGFDLSAGFGYTDSKLAGTTFVDTRAVALAFPGVANAPQCPTGQASTPPACLNYTPFIRTTAGGPALFSPKFTWNLSAAYAIEMDGVTITPRASYSHVGSRFTYIGYDPIRDRIPAYDLINASIAVDLGKFGVELWATNLGKERYVSGQGGVNEFYGAPREYGVRLKAEF